MLRKKHGIILVGLSPKNLQDYQKLFKLILPAFTFILLLKSSNLCCWLRNKYELWELNICQQVLVSIFSNKEIILIQSHDRLNVLI